MVWMYDNPKNLNYDNIDEPIRELCKTINESFWLRTEESCCGHFGDEHIKSAWSGAVPSLYLRLVVIDKGHLIRFLDFIQQLREGCKGQYGWNIQLGLDRLDEDGIHWFFYFNYDRNVRYRQIVIDMVHRYFKEASNIHAAKTIKDGMVSE